MKTLVKYHNSLSVIKAGPNDFNFAPGEGNNDGWEKLEGTVFLSETFIDMAGMALDDETIYPQAVSIQESGLGNAIAGAAGDSIVTMDIISSVYIDVAETYSDILLNGVGFPHGPGDYQHIQYVRTERHTLDIDTGAVFPFKAESNQAGSMAPTASDRLYVYRLVFVYDASNTVTTIKRQAGRVVLAADLRKEAEYEYIMRLKRSYDLQQTPDRD